MGHAQHPNYPEKHQAIHTPRLHGGPVIWNSAAQKFMSDSSNSAVVRKLAVAAGIPVQDCIAKQGTSNGSTIGPPIASHTGIKTVDVGVSQLAMHSIREMCGVQDTWFYKKLFREFFETFTREDGELFC